MDATFEVAVSRQRHGDDEIPASDLFGYDGRKRAGIPDAGSAAVTDQVEAEFIEEGRESGAFIISRHDPRAGSEGRLDPGLPVQSAFDRALGKQAGCQHDRGI